VGEDRLGGAIDARRSASRGTGAAGAASGGGPVAEHRAEGFERALPDEEVEFGDEGPTPEPDLDRARSMYERAIELAGERLAAPDLSAGDRERFETALQDATTNLEDLLDPEGAEGRARARAEARRKERAEEEGAGSVEGAPETPSEESPD
jgi:hypothetical protein